MTADAGLRLEFSQPGSQVRACFTPDAGHLPPDRASLDASLEACLAEHGWQGARLDAAAVRGFLTQCQLTDRKIDAVIGSVLDGEFELEITADKLRLLLTLVSPEGGRPITAEEIDGGGGLARQRGDRRCAGGR